MTPIIDSNTYSKLLKFDDDMKAGGIADTKLAAQQLQEDLDLSQCRTGMEEGSHFIWLFTSSGSVM